MIGGTGGDDDGESISLHLAESVLNDLGDLIIRNQACAATQ